MPVTEKDAATAYAKVWNRLDCSEFLDLFEENACYASLLAPANPGPTQRR